MRSGTNRLPASRKNPFSAETTTSVSCGVRRHGNGSYAVPRRRGRVDLFVDVLMLRQDVHPCRRLRRGFAQRVDEVA